MGTVGATREAAVGMAAEYDGQRDAALPVVGWTRRLEQARGLDGARRRLQPVASALVADPARRSALQGIWLGHALHPLLTDLPIGFWTSANVLDLAGGQGSHAAARRLVGLGLLAAVPAAVTGLSEWADTGEREQRVGVVHAGANTVALAMYTASWHARKQGRHARGVALGLAGSAAAAVGGYLGGHLVSARKVSSRNPVFDAEGPTPGN